MPGTNIPALPTLKFDLSYHPSIKDNIFEVNIDFPPRGTTIGITTQHCEHNNMSCIYQSENNSLWNHAFPNINRKNFWILIIGRK